VYVLLRSLCRLDIVVLRAVRWCSENSTRGSALIFHNEPCEPSPSNVAHLFLHAGLSSDLFVYRGKVPNGWVWQEERAEAIKRDIRTSVLSDPNYKALCTCPDLASFLVELSRMAALDPPLLAAGDATDHEVRVSAAAESV
jgi:hypothetical protein